MTGDINIDAPITVTRRELLTAARRYLDEVEHDPECRLSRHGRALLAGAIEYLDIAMKEG